MSRSRRRLRRSDNIKTASALAPERQYQNRVGARAHETRPESLALEPELTRSGPEQAQHAWRAAREPSEIEQTKVRTSLELKGGPLFGRQRSSRLSRCGVLLPILLSEPIVALDLNGSRLDRGRCIEGRKKINLP
jgi:hypothetical protein